MESDRGAGRDYQWGLCNRGVRMIPSLARGPRREFPITETWKAESAEWLYSEHTKFETPSESQGDLSSA